MSQQRVASNPHSDCMMGRFQRKTVDATAASLMLLFCLVLGFQQVAIKGVAEDISPVVQMALRSAWSVGWLIGAAFAGRMWGTTGPLGCWWAWALLPSLLLSPGG